MILVLGGTSESRDVTLLLVKNGFRILYSATTGIIDDLPPSVKRVTCKLDKLSFGELLCMYGVKCIIDATHPFAVNVTELAIKMSCEHMIPYIRFERSSGLEDSISDCVNYVDTLSMAVRLVCEMQGIIFSTLGTRMLPQLCEALGDRSHDLAVRVLPTVESIDTCNKLGIHSSRICAMQGPFSTEFNKRCIEHFGAKTMLSKESGDQGGLHEKAQSCIECDCKLIIIKRPFIKYPVVCDSADKCLDTLNNIIC